MLCNTCFFFKCLILNWDLSIRKIEDRKMYDFAVDLYLHMVNAITVSFDVILKTILNILFAKIFKKNVENRHKRQIYRG